MSASKRRKNKRSRDSTIKTYAQGMKYKNDLSKPGITVETTTNTANDFLIGSDEVYDYGFDREVDNRKPIPAPMSKKLIKWIKENSILIIVTAILIPLLGWLANSVIQLRIQEAEIRTSLKYIEEKFTVIQDDVVTKERYNVEMKALSEDLEKVNIFNIDSLIRRVEVIEAELKTYIDAE